MSIAPVVLTLVILITGFLLIEHRHLRVHEDRLFTLVHDALMRSNRHEELSPESLAALSKHMLYIDPICHISWVNQKGETISEFGLPLRLSDMSWMKPAGVSYASDRHLALMSLPVADDNGRSWIIVGLDSNHFQLIRYETWILVSLSAASALALAAFFALRFRYHIFRPLRKIVQQLHSVLESDSQQRIGRSANPLFHDLVNTINKLLDDHKQHQDDMQNYLEQSTLELRETLETVEIQNIELDIARKKAVQASKAKSEFLANTSHELRTPLNGILGFAGLLLKTSLSNQQRDYLTTVEHSAQGLLTVINDILDFSRLETGELTLEYKPVHVREIVEEISQLFAPQAHEKNLRLLAQVSENVQLNLLGDPLRLKQVISNLISNAIKFSSRGNIVIKVVSLGETDQQVEIKFSVSDNGIGLSSEQQKQLFDAFSKVDAGDGQLHGGAGLGLAIAKGLIIRMHGDIGVESELHRGSTFWFTIRLGIDLRRPRYSPLCNSLQRISVLIYDPDEQCRAEIAHHLTYWGAIQQECDQLDQLNEMLEQPVSGTPFQLVVMDAYASINCFDRDKLLNAIHRTNARFRIPMIVLAPPSIQRILQEDIVGLNTVIVSRPIVHGVFYQTICNQLNIAWPRPDADAATPAGRVRTAPIPQLTVLVVDDNQANRKLAVELLKNLNVRCQTAESGAQALELFQNEPFGLILMDVQMPGLDGLETTRLIRSRESGRRTPIVALTAHAVDEHKTRLLTAGMDDYLSKPVSEADLKMIIDRWVTQLRVPAEQLVAPPATPPESFAAESLATAPTSGQKVFDWNESMELARHKPDLAADMLRMLIKSVPETRTQLLALQESQDRVQLREVIHKFRGGCCYCGVPPLRAACERFENLLTTENPQDSIDDALNQVLTEMERLEDWVAELELETLFED